MTNEIEPTVGPSNEPLKLAIRSRFDDAEQIVRITLSGTLEFDTYHQLETELLAWIDRGRPSWIVDLEGLKALTTVAAAGFVGLLRVAQDHGGNVFVIEPTEEIAAVFGELEVLDLMPWVRREE